jgi:hypothetical protein
MAMGQVFFEFFHFPPLIIVPPSLHTSSITAPRGVRHSPDQAAHYHTLGTKAGASHLTRHLAGLEVMEVLVFSKWTVSLQLETDK